MTQATHEPVKHEPLAQRHHRHAYERMLVLSDGVFAIAITLLAFDIKLSGPTAGDWQSILNAVTPKLFAYAISFVVVAIFWTGQRRSFARYVRVDGVLAWLTLLFLGLVALIPAVSALISTVDGRGAATLYIGLAVMISIVQALTWGYAAFLGKLVTPEVTTVQRAYIFLVALFAPSIFAGLSLYMMSRHGHLSLPYWALLIALVASLRFATRRILKDIRY